MVAAGTREDSSLESLIANIDRKSTRLNSSHDQISYAVFCLKKKSVDLRSEEHTSELQSRSDLVCRLLLEKKNERSESIKMSVSYKVVERCVVINSQSNVYQ